jgi:hypothetical protein
MVHPRQHIQKVEREQLTLVDLWQTCVFLSLIFHQMSSFPLATWLHSRIRKEYLMVSHMRSSFFVHPFKPPTSSGIIQEVKSLRDTGLAHMTYFYCDFRDPKKQQVTGLLASLVAQLSAKSDGFHNILSTLYSECDAGS